MAELIVVDGAGNQQVFEEPISVSTSGVEPPPPPDDEKPTGEPPKHVGQEKFDLMPRTDPADEDVVSLHTQRYFVELDNGHQWLPGDRSSYKGGAYYFLADPDGKPVFRITYMVAGYESTVPAVLFDQGMAEGERWWDGTVAVGQGNELKDIPVFEKRDGAFRGDHRPVVDIWTPADGKIAERRDYREDSETTLDVDGDVAFDLIAATATPFTAKGLKSAAHTVFSRGEIGVFFRGELLNVLYYDSLDQRYKTFVELFPTAGGNTLQLSI